MQIGYTYAFETRAGQLTFMLVEDTIVAHYEDGGVAVHHVNEAGPEVDHRSPRTFAALIGYGAPVLPFVVVGRICHPSDTRIGVYNRSWREGVDWGYVWNVDHPERSYCERAERLEAALEPVDLPRRTGSLQRVTQDLSNLSAAVSWEHPRAAALVAAAGKDPDSLATMMVNLSQFQEWVAEYLMALDECRAIEEARS